MDNVAIHKDQVKWWWYLVNGIVSILLGWLVLSRPVNTIIALVLLLGFYLLIGGVINVVMSFVDAGKKGSHWGWKLVAGIVSVIVGLVVLNNALFVSILTPVMFMYIVAFSLIINGVVDMIAGKEQAGGHKWTWGTFVLGGLYLVLGLMLLGMPNYYAVSTVVQVTGWFLIFIGLGNAVVAFSVKGNN